MTTTLITGMMTTDTMTTQITPTTATTTTLTMATTITPTTAMMVGRQWLKPGLGKSTTSWLMKPIAC